MIFWWLSADFYMILWGFSEDFLMIVCWFSYMFQCFIFHQLNMFQYIYINLNSPNSYKSFNFFLFSKLNINIYSKIILKFPIGLTLIQYRRMITSIEKEPRSTKSPRNRYLDHWWDWKCVRQTCSYGVFHRAPKSSENRSTG